MLLLGDITPPFDEPCTASSFIPPAPTLVNAANENQVNELLRAAARTKDPLTILSQAAVASFAVGHADALRSYLDGRNPIQIVALEAMGNPPFAPALADLAVTGRTSFEQFSSIGPRESLLLDKVRALVNGWPEATQDNVLYALRQALDRAYLVARALRWYDAREPLGWIAVAGEDDPPSRPVNVPSAPYRQHDITVTVKGIPVETRFIIASDTNLLQPPPAIIYPPPPFGGPPTDLPRPLPGDGQPVLPEGEVFLYIHGHSSRLEEALDLIPRLTRVSREHGRPCSIIAMDLPCCGYSSMFDHTQVEPPEASDWPCCYPILDFIEEFIVQFVNTLSEQWWWTVRNLKDRIVAVIGGSLGGNMGLRLGRRSEPWLKNIVAWSPASVWDSFAHPWNPFKQEALRVARDRMNEEEQPGRRNEYFYEAFEESHDFLGIGHVPPQPQMWYREGWPCKQNYIQGARLERQEIYNPSFRRWHWRVAREQLLYSHLDPERDGGPPRYTQNLVNTMLLAGSEDSFNFSNIYAATKTIAKLMEHTPGRALFFDTTFNTGHSIHNERPLLLALAIEDFLLGLTGFDDGSPWHTAQATPSSGFGDWQIMGEARGLGRIAVGSNADHRLEIFAVDTAAGLAWHTVQNAPNGSFGGWARLGDAVGVGEITAISTHSGSLEVFAVDTSAGQVWTIFQDGPNGNFEGWVPVSDKVGLHYITVGKNDDGRLEVFALDAAGRVWHSVQPTPRDAFGSWSQLGDAVGVAQIEVTSTHSGSLEVFAVDGDAGLAWTIFQDGPNGSFEGWVNMSGIKGLHYITVGKNDDGRLEVFALDAAGRVWHSVQPTPRDAFGSWSQLGDAVGVGEISVISTQSGSLEVFAVDTPAGLAWTIFQNGPNGSFESWVPVGDKAGLHRITGGKNDDGRLEVFSVLQQPSSAPVEQSPPGPPSSN